MSEIIDIGHDHTMEYTRWAPDRELNPQYANVPDVEKLGVLITHKKKDGSPCASHASFDCEVSRTIFKDRAIWQVISWEPLTLSPSILCLAEGCGDHGFIREGKWVPA